MGITVSSLLGIEDDSLIPGLQSFPGEVGVSLKDTSVTYIGETNNIVQRLQQHNSGHGSKHTRSQIHRPWALLAYVLGFGGSASKLKAFESQWKTARLQHGGTITTNKIARLESDTHRQNITVYFACLWMRFFSRSLASESVKLDGTQQLFLPSVYKSFCPHRLHLTLSVPVDVELEDFVEPPSPGPLHLRLWTSNHKLF